MLEGFPIAEVGVHVRVKGGTKSALAIAKKICDRYLTTDIVGGLQAFVEICHSIDLAKVKAVGKAASTKESNQLMFLVGAHWVDRSPCNISIMQTVEQFADGLEKSGAWEYPKVYNLQILVNRKVLAKDMAEKTRLPKLLRRLTAPVFANGTDEFLNSHIVELIQAMDELRKYGLKPAAFTDLYSKIAGKQWVLTDGADNAPGWTANDALGTFYLTDPTVQDFRLRRNQKVGEHYNMNGVTSHFDAHAVWTLNSSGHLDLSGGLGLISCEKIFEEADAMGLYDGIRVNSVMHVFDLVVPVNTANKVPGVRLRRGLSGILQGVLNIGNVMRDLVIPRIKSLKTISEVERDLQDEISRDIAEAARRGSIREHEVIGFTRKIRDGYIAPTDVVIRAWEESRITLQPGETYVRKHSRGNPERGKVVGHRIKKRRRH